MKYVKLFGFEHTNVPRSVAGLRLGNLDAMSTVPFTSRGRIEATVDNATKTMALTATTSTATSKTGGCFIKIGSLCENRAVTELTFGFRFKRGIQTQPVNYTYVSLCEFDTHTASVNFIPDVYITPLRCAVANTQPTEGYYELTFTLQAPGSGLDGKVECFLEGALVFTAGLSAATWNTASIKDRFIFLGTHNSSLNAFNSSVVGGGAVDDVVCYFGDVYAQADDSLRDGSTRFGPVLLKRLPAKADSVIPWDSLNGATPVGTDKVTSLNQNRLDTTLTPHFRSDTAKSAIRIKPDVSSIAANSVIRAVSGGHGSYKSTADALSMRSQWSYNGVLGDPTTDAIQQAADWTGQLPFQLPAFRRLPGDLQITKASLANLELVLTPLAV